MNNPSNISVVICSYNGEKDIAEQIDSILEQTLLPKEIIVGDDGSTDSTLSVIEDCRLRIEAKRIRLSIYQNNHLGAHGNFKATLPKATCELIAPCDQDDIWLPEKLEKCAAAMVDGVDLVACRDQVQNEDGLMGEILGHTLAKHMLLWGNSVYGHLMLIRRSALDVYRIAPKVTFDWGLALYAAATGTGVLIDDVECIWRRHPGVVTTEFSNNKGYELVVASKWTKLYRSLCLLINNVRSAAITTTMDNTARIYAYYGQKKYAAIAENMRKQRPIALLMACWKNAWLHTTLPQYKKLNLHEKIGCWCYQFCYPAIWWYDYHTHKSL